MEQKRTSLEKEGLIDLRRGARMNRSETNTVGAYEAKTRFSQLLERVASGEEITITRHGSPVAGLVPALSAHSVERRSEAISKMRELASRNRLDGLRVQDLIAEGRR
jgi:prevent-host-death family protein